MAIFNLVDDVLSDVKLRANQPTSGAAMTDAEMLRLGNDEMQGILTGRLMQAMEGYYLTEAVVPTVATQFLYDIPTRAAGAKIAYAVMQDTTGARRNLIFQPAGRLAQSSRATAYNGAPQQAFFQGNQIRLYPAPSDTTESIVVGYYQRPGRLVLAASAAIVTAAGAVAATSLTAHPGVPSTLFATGTYVDTVRATPHFIYTNTDLLIASTTTTSLTFTTTPLAGAVAVGDYVCVQNESCIVQLPVETVPLLTARWALRLMKARSPSSPDTASMGQDVTDLEAQLFEYLSNRSESQLECIGPGALTPRQGRMGLNWVW